MYANNPGSRGPESRVKNVTMCLPHTFLSGLDVCEVPSFLFLALQQLPLPAYCDRKTWHHSDKRSSGWILVSRKKNQREKKSGCIFETFSKSCERMMLTCES